MVKEKSARGYTPSGRGNNTRSKPERPLLAHLRLSELIEFYYSNVADQVKNYSYILGYTFSTALRPILGKISIENFVVFT